MLYQSNAASADYLPLPDGNLIQVRHSFANSSVEFNYGFNRVHDLIYQHCSDSEYLWRPTDSSIETYGVADEVNKYTALFQYYSNKNQITNGPWNYVFDNENHLIQAHQTTIEVLYSYDPLHRLSQKLVTNFSQARFIYSGWQRIAEYDTILDTIRTKYIYGEDDEEPLISIDETDNVTYFHHDRLGSIVATSNNLGLVSERFEYGPFGETNPRSQDQFAYTGQIYDSTLELGFYKLRFYSPRLGRFLQTDPIAYQQSKSKATSVSLAVHPYNYLENSPFAGGDIWGLWPNLVPGKKSAKAVTERQLKKNLPKCLTDAERKKLANDIIEKIRASDVKLAQALFPKLPWLKILNPFISGAEKEKYFPSLNDLSPEQLDKLYEFLDKLPPEDKPLVDKVKKDCDDRIKTRVETNVQGTVLPSR